MRRTLAVLVLAASPLVAQQQQSKMDANAAVSSAKAVWALPHGFLERSLEMVPDSLLGFKPTPEVRSLGQLFAHVADAEFAFCALALGEPMRPQAQSIEKTKSTKAELLQALKESGAYCERAYAQSDASAMTAAEFFGRKTNRMFILNLNGAHDYEHYGNVVTYLRIKGMVPPSSM